MFCPNCGKQIADGFAFCPHCGKETSAQPKEQSGDQHGAPSGGSGGYYVNPQGYQSYGQQNYNPYVQQPPYAPQSPYTLPNTKKYPGRGLGIAGMVVGICALFYALLNGTATASIILGVLAVVFGAVSLTKGRAVGRKNGFATAGLSCGIVALAIDAFVVFYSIAMYGYYAF